MNNRRNTALYAIITLFMLSLPLPADELGETNRNNIDHNRGRIGTIESNIAVNTQNIDLNAQMIGLNGAAITALQQQVEAIELPASYDFKDYSVAGDITGKVYSMKGMDCGDSESREYTRTPVGDATQVTMLRIRSQAGIPCQRRTFDYLVTDEDRRLVRNRVYNLSGSTLKSTRELVDPVVLRHASMQVGQSWGGASEVTQSPEPVFGAVHVLANKSTLLGIEDISVAYNGGTTFNGCLKIGTQRTSDTIGQFMRVEWFCPDVGMVKRMQNSLETPPRAIVWELTAINR